MATPNLIEPGAKYFIGGSLRECRKFKDRYISYFFNLGMTLVFIIGVGAILTYRYKGNISHSELELKHRKKKEYIISKLHQISSMRQQQNMITDMPTWNTNPDLQILQRR